MSASKYKWNLKLQRRAIRFLQGQIKTPPRSLNKLGVVNFKIGDDPNKLMFNDEGKWKQIVAEEDARQLLFDIDCNPQTGHVGRDKLFSYVQEHYVGVSRAKVMDYLSNSESHQLNAPLKKRAVVKPIVAKGKGVQWGIDLVDMSNHASSNNNYKWWLTCVDQFSKMGYVAMLRSKSKKDVLAGIDEIMENIPASWRPSLAIGDRGSEWAKYFEQHMKSKWGVKVIHSLAYTPQSNGQIEKLNRTWKERVFQHFTKFNTQRYLDVLPLIVKGYNQQVHSSTGEKPIDIMQSNDPTLQERVHERLVARALRTMSKSEPLKEQDIRVGNSVRVALTTKASIRKKKFRKKISQNWSDRIYEVVKIHEPTEIYVKPRFTIAFNGKPRTKHFYSYQLLKLDLNNLIKDPEIRPDYRPDLFNSEEHMRTGIRNIRVETTLPQSTLLEERKSRPQRVRSAPQRYAPT